VIRQDYGSLDREGMPCAHLAKRGPQEPDMLDQHLAPPVSQIDRKEIASVGRM